VLTFSTVATRVKDDSTKRDISTVRFWVRSPCSDRLRSVSSRHSDHPQMVVEVQSGEPVMR
jgi:hypothetical protein